MIKDPQRIRPLPANNLCFLITSEAESSWDQEALPSTKAPSSIYKVCDPGEEYYRENRSQGALRIPEVLVEVWTDLPARDVIGLGSKKTDWKEEIADGEPTEKSGIVAGVRCARNYQRSDNTWTWGACRRSSRNQWIVDTWRGEAYCGSNPVLPLGVLLRLQPWTGALRRRIARTGALISIRGAKYRNCMGPRKRASKKHRLYLDIVRTQS